MQATQHHYLQAMGIQVWQSREVLPGAKPGSLVTDFPGQTPSDEHSNVAIEAAETSSVVDMGSQGAVAVSEPQLRVEKPDASVLVPVAEKLPVSQTETPRPTVDETTEKKAPVEQLSNPEFRIASIIFPGVCVVVTQVPVQAVAPFSPEHIALVKELLWAINKPMVDEPLVTLFNWPMLRSADFDQSAEAACEASNAFLRGQKSKHDVGFVLLMGDAPGQFLLSEQGNFTDKTGRLYQSDGQLPRLLTHSLEQIFADATLKAQVWHDLQPLMAWQNDK